jgi:uncharacterized protein (TIGR03000 family)
MSRYGVWACFGVALSCALPSVSSAQGPAGFYSPYYYLRHGSYYEPNYYGSTYPTWDSSAFGPGTVYSPAEYSPYDYLRHGTYSWPGYNGYYGPSGVRYNPYRSTSLYYSPTTTTMADDAKSAAVEVRVPANAEVWIDGTATKQKGETRTFETPAFRPGSSFTYDIRARWTDSGGKVVDQSRQVTLQAGSRSTVDFRKQ